MADGSNRAPGFAMHPDQRVDIAPAPERVRFTVDGVTVADSRRALKVDESGHDTVYYFPREDVRMEMLSQTRHTSHCPFKGDAAYWSLKLDGKTAENAVWAYDEPFEEGAPVKGHVAFWLQKIDGGRIELG